MNARSFRRDVGRLRVGACLSLSGRHARFGRQACLGLEVWLALEDEVELIIEDDRSDPGTLECALRRLSASCDILLGPYSTQLMRRAGDVAADLDRLIWNHGGSGDDVEAAHLGHVVSVLTPTSRYAEPFLRHLRQTAESSRLWIVQGKGSFGRQVAGGAELMARALGIDTVQLGPGDGLPIDAVPENWSLFCAGSFEEDVATVSRARGLSRPPLAICAVAAGVREFGEAVGAPEGIFGVGQWFPGSGGKVELGPSEADFLAAYEQRVGTALPDYPAVQAAGAAVIAAHCARAVGATTRSDLWSAALALDTTTLFGRFAIDPASGVQTGHEPALVRWGPRGPGAV